MAAELQRESVIGDAWPDNFTLVHTDSATHSWAGGLTLREAAARRGVDPIGFVAEVLSASLMRVTVVMRVRHPHPLSSLVELFTHERAMVGSDGISLGSHPHPRAWGAFAKTIRLLVRDEGVWSWSDVREHLSARPARRFGLGRRGVIEPGAVADLALVDPQVVADQATYPTARAAAVGIDDVWVTGVRVLSDGALTAATPGRGLRRGGMHPGMTGGGLRHGGLPPRSSAAALG